MDSRFVATLLRSSASAYAAMAVTRALESTGSATEADVGFGAWREHFSSLVQELAAAVDGGTEAQFVAKVEWARDAFVARGLESGLLRAGLMELHKVLEESLPGGASAPIPGLLQAADSVLESKQESHESDEDPLNDLARQYLSDVRAGEGQRAIEAVVGAIKDGRLSITDALDGVLAPVLRETGRLWHAGELNVAEEHFATQTASRMLEQISLLAPRANDLQRTVLLTMVEGDAHELGLRIVSTYFEIDGWRTICLGANTPGMDLKFSAEQFGADLVVIGATLNTQRDAVARAIEGIRSARPNQRILVGGPAFSGIEDRVHEMGADGCVRRAGDGPRQGRDLIVN